MRVKSKSFIANLRKWNREAEAAGKIVSVFPSLCDPFEDRPELEPWRREMFAAIDECPHVHLLLLTKRPENVRRMWTKRRGMEHHSNPYFWLHRENVWLGTSISNQDTADRMIAELLKCRDLCPVLFLSAEPLLGPIDLTRIPTGHWAYGKVDVMSGYLCGSEPDDVYDFEADPHGWVRNPAGKWERGEYGINWVIVGGESGPGARPMHPDWARSLRDQCQAAGVPFFFKQWGEWEPGDAVPGGDLGGEFRAGKAAILAADGTANDGHFRRARGDAIMRRVGKAAAGRLLDGREWSEFPEVASVT